MVPMHRLPGSMWALLRFALVTLALFPSGIVCDIETAPTPLGGLSIQTPGNQVPLPIYGKSYTFQWTGDHPNFTLKLFDFTGTLCRTFSNITDHSVIWNPVDIQSGTELFLVLTDALSNSINSGHFTILSYEGSAKNTSSPNKTSTSTVAGEASAQPTTTTAGHASSDAATPSISEDTSPFPSPPTALNIGMIFGISLGVLAMVAAGIVCLFMLHKTSISPVNPLPTDADWDEDRHEHGRPEEVGTVTQANSSLLVRPSSSFVDSTLPPDYNDDLRQPRQHSDTDGAIAVPEKLMRDLRSRAVPSASIAGSGMNEHTDATLDVVIPSGHGVVGHRGHLQYETNGGVRTAGGRAGVVMPADDFDQQSASEDGSTLPSSDYGDP